MSSKIELLPCPFCGVIPKFERVDGRMSDPNGSEFWGVICRSGKNVGGACEVNIPARRSKESAAKAWNTRAAPPELAELQATIAHLRNDLEGTRLLAADQLLKINQQRAEIEQLKGGQGEPVEEFTRDQVEIVAESIYWQWAGRKGFVPWVKGGNSLKQDEARSIAWSTLDKVKELNQ